MSFATNKILKKLKKKKNRGLDKSLDYFEKDFRLPLFFPIGQVFL